MKKIPEITTAILEAVYFMPKQLKDYGNWKDIPEATALRLSNDLALAIDREVRKFADEVARAYTYYPSADTRALLNFSLPEEPIRLAFDPTVPVRVKGLSMDARFDAVRVHKIFQNKISRNLWLGIRGRFITSQHFIPDILNFAAAIRERGKPNHWQDLFNIFCLGNDGIFCHGLGRSPLREMAMLLLPYARGEREFKWKVEVKNAP